MLIRDILKHTLLIVLWVKAYKQSLLASDKDACTSDSNYKMKVNEGNLFVFTKRIKEANCVRIMTQGYHDLDLYFHDTDAKNATFHKTIEAV